MTPLGLDFSRASPARVYNFLLGGKSWSEIDRQVGLAILRSSPHAREVAKANFLFAGHTSGRVVKQFGIRQVLDIGAGIVDDVPLPSVETCVLQADPNATVIGVDNDEVVLTHARALRGYDGVLKGDVTHLDGIFRHPRLVDRIDLAEPTLIVLAAVLHFVADPAAVMAGLRARLAPGSVVIVSHATKTRTSEERVAGIAKAYEQGSSSIIFRDQEEIAALADGCELLPPGLTDVQLFSADGACQAEVYESVRVVGMAARLPGGPVTLEGAHVPAA